MSSGNDSSVPTSKLQDPSGPQLDPAKVEENAQGGPSVLEEDDEFEDFPVEDWGQEDSAVPAGGSGHLWEESWDDDDTSEDFSKQLKEELEKVKANK